MLSRLASRRSAVQAVSKSIKQSIRPVVASAVRLNHINFQSSQCRVFSSKAEPSTTQSSLTSTLIKEGQYHTGKLINWTIFPERRVCLIELNRPQALNALNDDLMRELVECMTKYDADSNVGCFIVTGSQKSFAAGADIKQMSVNTFSTAYNNDLLGHWSNVRSIRKPIIAGVSGYALGGGCELAMMCDFIVASESAKFGQPEVLLGTIPGGGGSQRLTHLVGKSKAMEMILTGDSIDAQEAKSFNMVSRVVPNDELIDTCINIATKIGSFSTPIIEMAKETVNAAFESPLSVGLQFEKRMFHATFATKDQKEGMGAFLEKPKRKAVFKHE